MKTSKPKIEYEQGKVFYKVDIRIRDDNRTLWFSLDEKYDNLISDKSDAALIALLIPAMQVGEDIHIDGKISKRLFYNLSRPIQKILQLIIPSLRRIKIYATEISEETLISNKYVATGFSGGVDSFSVLADHFYNNNPNYEVTHLLFNRVGSNHSGGEELFQKRFEHLLPLTKKIGLPFIRVNSNLHDFYSKEIGFKQTHTFRNTSAAMVLQSGIGHFMYASGYSYPQLYVGKSEAIAKCDPLIMPLLSTEGVNIISVGSEYSRVEKTMSLVEIKDTYDTLNVCVNAQHKGKYINCSKCFKCLRTLATLDIAEKLHLYDSSFDISLYKKLRKNYFAKIYHSENVLDREVINLAKNQDFPIPLSSRANSIRHLSMMNYPRRILKKLIKI